MANEASIKAVITADDKASGVLKGFGDKVDGVGHALVTTAKAAAVGLAAAGAAAVAFGASSVKAYSEAQDGIAQTNAVLESTGKAAGVSAKEVSDLSTSLQKLTKFSDEEIRSGQNLLLTFTKIGKDIFPEATEVMLDMSQALGQDLKSSAVQLGKALQDPILGVTALRRVGVNFSEAQQDVIKGLVDTGQAAEAQRLILKELQTEFGGSAKAAGQTFAGKLAILKNQFNDVQEAIGLVIVEGLQPFMARAADFVNAIDWEKVIDRTTKSIKDLYEELVPLINLIKSSVVNTIEAISDAVEFLAPSFEALARTVRDDLYPALKSFWQDIVVPLAPAIGTVLVASFWLAINAIRVYAEYISILLDGLSAFARFITDDLPAAVETGVNIVIEKFRWLKDNALSLLGEITGFFITLPVMLPIYMAMAIAKVVSTIVAVKWSDVFSGIWQGMQAAWDVVTKIVNDAWHKIHDMPWGALFTGIGRSFANGLIDLIEGALRGALTGLPGNIEKKINLPRFDQGGIVPGNVGSPQLVVAHGGETILPTHKKGLAGGSTPANITIQVNAGAFMGTDTEARKFAQIIMSHLKDAAGSKNMSVGQLLGN